MGPPSPQRHLQATYLLGRAESAQYNQHDQQYCSGYAAHQPGDFGGVYHYRARHDDGQAAASRVKRGTSRPMPPSTSALATT